VRHVTDDNDVQDLYEARCETASVCTTEMYEGEVCEESNGIETCKTCVDVECKSVTGELQ